MRRLVLLLAILTLAPPGAARTAGRAGEFDYYVLALSWNAAWCAARGDARAAAQCEPRHEIGFILHGLWPQYENGWPEYCETTQPDASRAETAAMADIMGSGGLARHQWNKHGRCSGLAPAAYFALARKAWEAISRPEMLRRIAEPLRLAPRAIEQAFIEANPGLTAGGVTVTCKDGRFREVRICLTNSLTPRPCTGETARDCTISDPLFQPMR